MLRLSRAQLREVDRIAIEEYGLPGVVLMENAARSAADILFDTFTDLRERSIAIICGHGNNGGDGYAIARHLVNRGCHVDLLNDGPARGDAGAFQRVCAAMKIQSTSVYDIESFVAGVDLFVDAIFGTGLSRAPVAPMREAIEVMNESGHPVIALDIPSGLDCDTGEPLGEVCIRATKTITFVAEKVGFANPPSRDFTGDVIVADIGVPRSVVAQVSNL